MAGGMNKRGSWGPMTERLEQTAGAVPSPPAGLQHCWITDRHGRFAFRTAPARRTLRVRAPEVTVRIGSGERMRCDAATRILR